jgi:thymidylate kinase
MPSTPLRAAVVGIDGAGKSSTALRAVALLASGLRVVKPGRNAFFAQGGAREELSPRIDATFERLFAKVDATRNRRLIGASRVAFISYQGFIEPRLVERTRADLVLGTRCMIVDPAIYAPFYSPAVGRLSLRARLGMFERLSRLPYRDLYLLLRTPPAVAIERIHKRIAKAPGYECQPRDYWLHLHERADVLQAIGSAFEEALALVAARTGAKVVLVDTTAHDEAGVASFIAEVIGERWAQPPRRTCI